MKKQKDSTLLIVASSALFVTVFFLFGFAGKARSGLSLSFSADKSDVAVGEQFDVAVHLSGAGASSATVAELSVEYDDSVLQLIEAEPGGLFGSPLLVNWDLNASDFALSINPASPVGTSVTDKALIYLTFKALAPASGVEVTASESQVYLQGEGVVSPSVKVGTFRVNAEEN